MAVMAESASPSAGDFPSEPEPLAKAMIQAPVSARATATRNIRWGRCRRNIQAAAVTKTGVKFDSTVALATEV